MADRKRCYYEVLGVEDLATDRELTKAYRKKALQFHPDKNHHRQEAAAEEFKEVQNAYAVLSDPDERAWYDSHKEQILTGRTDLGPSAPNEVNLFDFSNVSCYKGYGDGAGGFYAVYTQLFKTVAKEDNKYQRFNDMPPDFGNSETPWPRVQAFYSFWLGYSTRKNFMWKDEYKPSEMQDRYERRAAERHNDKVRAAARNEYNQTLRFLTNFVKRHDPRVKAEQERQDKLREEKELARDLAAAEGVRKRKEQRDLELAEAAEEEEEWAREAEERERLREEQLEAMREAEAKRLAEEEAERQAEAELAAAAKVVLRCDACKKTMKTEKLMDEHVKSAKHKNKVKQMIAKGELPAGWQPGAAMSTTAAEQEGDATKADDGDDASAKSCDTDDEIGETPATREQQQQPKKGGKKAAAAAPLRVDEDTDTEDDTTARGKKASKKAARKKQQAAAAAAAAAEDTDESDAPVMTSPGPTKKGKKGKKGGARGRGDSDDDADGGDAMAAEIERTMAAAATSKKQQAKAEKAERRAAGVRGGGGAKKKGGATLAPLSSSGDSDDESDSDDAGVGRGGGFAALTKPTGRNKRR